MKNKHTWSFLYKWLSDGFIELAAFSKNKLYTHGIILCQNISLVHWHIKSKYKQTNTYAKSITVYLIWPDRVFTSCRQKNWEKRRRQFFGLFLIFSLWFLQRIPCLSYFVKCAETTGGDINTDPVQSAEGDQNIPKRCQCFQTLSSKINKGNKGLS